MKKIVVKEGYRIARYMRSMGRMTPPIGSETAHQLGSSRDKLFKLANLRTKSKYNIDRDRLKQSYSLANVAGSNKVPTTSDERIRHRGLRQVVGGNVLQRSRGDYKTYAERKPQSLGSKIMGAAKSGATKISSGIKYLGKSLGSLAKPDTGIASGVQSSFRPVDLRQGASAMSKAQPAAKRVAPKVSPVSNQRWKAGQAARKARFTGTNQKGRDEFGAGVPGLKKE